MNELKKITALEIKINTLRLEMVALKDQLNRLANEGINKLEDSYLSVKIKFLSKKFELARLRSEKKLLEMRLHPGPKAA